MAHQRDNQTADSEPAVTEDVGIGVPMQQGNTNVAARAAAARDKVPPDPAVLRDASARQAVLGQLGFAHFAGQLSDRSLARRWGARHRMETCSSGESASEP